MKTTEQIRQEVLNYLSKTANHTFQKPKATFKYGDVNTPGHYEYDYENVTYFKIIKKDEDFFILEDNKLRKIDIDNYIKWNKKNAKCVIKHSLFLNKGMRGIRNNKYVKAKIEEILNPTLVKA